MTLHEGNRKGIENARKGLEDRVAHFDKLGAVEQKHTLQIQAAAKDDPAYGYRFPVRENGMLRPPKPDDGPQLDAVITVQQYFSGEPQFGLPAGRGWYRVKAVAYALKNDGKPTRLKFTVEEGYSGKLPKAVSVFAFTDEQPREVEARYYLEPGDRVVFTIMDGAPHSQGRTMIDQPGPFIAIRSFSIEGPVYESWPPKGHRTLFGDIDPTQPTPEKAAAIAAHLAPKLFRRPVDDVVVAKYAEFAKVLAHFTQADAAKCETFQDYRRLLDRARDKDKLDAVIIATPDHHHAQAAIFALQAGLNVYLEKPLTVTIREGRLLADAVKRTGRVLQVGSQQRIMEVNRFACEFIRNGGLGRISKVELPNYPGPLPMPSLDVEPAFGGVDFDLFCGPTPLRPHHRHLWMKEDFKVGDLLWRGWDLYRDYSGHLMTNWGAHTVDMVQLALGRDDTGPGESSALAAFCPRG